jgi:hypothetical protein
MFKNKLSKLAQILEIINNNFKPILLQKFSRIQVYNALALEAKFGHLEKRIKKNKYINRDEIFQKNSRVHRF